MTSLDQSLVSQLVACGSEDDEFNIVPAKTMCANDFYEGKYLLTVSNKDHVQSKTARQYICGILLELSSSSHTVKVENLAWKNI